jgi:hypothetical protein
MSRHLNIHATNVGRARSPWSVTAAEALVACGIALLLLAGCSPKTVGSASEAATRPRVEKSSSGPVTVTFTIDPPVVRLDRDTLFSIRLSAPTNISVKLPAVESRLAGFVVAGSYDSPTETRDGVVHQERHVRLTPQVAPLYRISPMPIPYKQGREERWFPTRPVVLEDEPLMKGDPGRELASPRGPEWIYPGLKTVVAYLVGGAALAALGYGLWRLLRRVQRAVKLSRMSPRERALTELAELLAKDLLTKQQVKLFYFELTMIVRAYVERAHAIRAPEQTTEEFLQAVSQDLRFSSEVVNRLRAFLQAADMVKYAAYRPDRPTVDQALATARNYIETDSGKESSQASPLTSQS